IRIKKLKNIDNHNFNLSKNLMSTSPSVIYFKNMINEKILIMKFNFFYLFSYKFRLARLYQMFL
ncbi:hypothetical protein, partial [Cetobacterium sp.]|uniref:hypothetical protein n=1 Tax=Cetobacterium sp. TaxID=2071632 RepID=UPI003EE60D39